MNCFNVVFFGFPMDRKDHESIEIQIQINMCCASFNALLSNVLFLKKHQVDLEALALLSSLESPLKILWLTETQLNEIDDIIN